MVRKLFLLGIYLTISLVKVEAVLPPPAYFYDEASRYLTLTYLDFNKVRIEVRNVGAPGESSKWNADGEKKDKEILFSRTPGEGEARGTFYIATGGESHLSIKLKPKQDKEIRDEGLVGKYVHLTDAKRLQLAKKEAEAADKRLQELLKTLPKKWPSADKTAALEIKLRWPSLKERLVGLAPATTKAEPAAKPLIGSSQKPEDVAEKQPEHWLTLAGVIGAEIGFASGAPDPKVQDGWVGDFTDGFGGSINVQQVKDGTLRVTLVSTRNGDESTAQINGNAVIKPGTEPSALFTDNNPEIKEASDHARAKLRLVGHYLIMDTEKTARYTARGWFEGVYRKQPPATE